jgi:hypothetical protein
VHLRISLLEPKLQIEVVDRKGNKKVPKEWYSVPYDVIEDAIQMISSGEIVKFVYDSETEKLVKK